MTPDGFTVVAGSLGDQGGAVARSLNRCGKAVRALTHNREAPAVQRLEDEGVEVLNDNLDVPDVVNMDLRGASHVFAALTPFDEGGLVAEMRQVRNLGGAALQAGVRRFVYSAVGDPDVDRDGGADAIWGVEQRLLRFNLPLTLLRPAFFMENLEEYALRGNGDGEMVLRMPLGKDTRVQWIAVDDVGELARLAFDRPDAFGPGPVQLAADELTFAEAMDVIGDVLGAEVRYEQISLDEVEDEHAHGMYRWFQTYAHYHADIDRLRELHPGLMSLRDWLEAGRIDLSKVEEGPAA